MKNEESIEIEKMDIAEVKKLKEKIRTQVGKGMNLIEDIMAQSMKLSELTPENEILKKWVNKLTDFSDSEISEIVRIEKFFPGSIECGLKRAEELFDGKPLFNDFVEGAKTVSFILLQGKINDEQIEILKGVTLDTLSSEWGKVREYNLDDEDLVPKVMQDLFSQYLYNASIESENKFIEVANLSVAAKMKK